MSELHEGLRNKNDVLNMCRLMVRAEDPEHRLQILRVLDVRHLFIVIISYKPSCNELSLIRICLM